MTDQPDRPTFDERELWGTFDWTYRQIEHTLRVLSTASDELSEILHEIDRLRAKS